MNVSARLSVVEDSHWDCIEIDLVLHVIGLCSECCRALIRRSTLLQTFSNRATSLRRPSRPSPLDKSVINNGRIIVVRTDSRLSSDGWH